MGCGQALRASADASGMFYVTKGDKLKGCIEMFLLLYTPGVLCALSTGWLGAGSSSEAGCG